MIPLSEDNFIMYAIKYYENPSCAGIHEFYADMKKIKYIKRLLGRYKTGGGLKERLILNHIIVLYNLFGAEATTNMLFFRVDKKLWPELKTFLLYLNLMPSDGILYDGTYENSVPINLEIANTLRRL